MNPQHCFQHLTEKTTQLWIDPNSSMPEIQRFVALMAVFHAKGGIDPLRFTLTPKKALKARLLYVSNVTVVRPLPHPRFTHPTTGTDLLRFSEALSIAKKLQGIPEGERLTTRTKFIGLQTKG